LNLKDDRTTNYNTKYSTNHSNQFSIFAMVNSLSNSSID